MLNFVTCSESFYFVKGANDSTFIMVISSKVCMFVNISNKKLLILPCLLEIKFEELFYCLGMGSISQIQKTHQDVKIKSTDKTATMYFLQKTLFFGVFME